ncbi:MULTISPECIES: site-2 protease family protein [Bacillus cereus group]|uniref:Site-2 protease family protein n=1 Tax=Bacillus cereus TaxID=1396 RepID=A0AA44QA39_BACCE|nr:MULTISPECIES: site-2 protease family protein [Bacillus cereus group]EEL51479.1 Peptidase M50 [Bacillus cereus Rock3-44]PFA19441.1 site-2 protease family protein [Bacillus cereus]PFN02922.1 site-2 protease family protein [Bacillus cereus]PFO82538.1 site-2 protease family protein [Bacillus cereus]PFR31570.1 site-2 protease family protein [Bacillus cereus]
MKNNKKGLWGIVAAVGIFLLSKLKWVFAIFKFAKFSTVFSMLLSLGAYATIYGWKFGVALIYLLFVHEMGHLWAAKRKGIPTSPAIFIPFMGALIGMKEMPKNAKDEAYIAYMGPLFGLLSFLPAIPLYIITGEPFWALVILLGSILNFFNLIPVSPLDGGRIISAVSTKIWMLGLAILLGYSIFFKSIMGGFIFIVGCMELYRVMKRNKPIEELGYKVDVMRAYLAKFQEEFQETEAVHRKIYMIHHEMNLLRQRERENQLKTGERQKMEVIEYILKKFEPLDYVPYEDEKEEHTIRITEALEVSERKMNKWEKEKQQQEDYYKIDTKTKWTVFVCYIGLLVILGYTAYEGYIILQEHLPNRNM